MKAIINTLRKTNCITEERLHVSREIFKFSNSKDGYGMALNVMRINFYFNNFIIKPAYYIAGFIIF